MYITNNTGCRKRNLLNGLIRNPFDGQPATQPMQDLKDILLVPSHIVKILEEDTKASLNLLGKQRVKRQSSFLDTALANR